MTDDIETVRKMVGDAIFGNMNTPDLPELMLQDSHYVFMYGTFRYGFPRYEQMKKRFKLLGSGWTSEEDYLMYNALSSGGSAFPIASETPLNDYDYTDYGHVFGDLFLVSTDTMTYLDCIESNGEMYQRELVSVKVHTKDKNEDGSVDWKPRTVSAWMYVGCPEFWEGAKNVKQMKKNKDKGYLYTLDLCESFWSTTNDYYLSHHYLM